MTQKKSACMWATLGMAALASLVSQPVAADDSGWYIGVGAGQSRANIDDKRIMDELLGVGLATTTIRDEDRHFGYKALGGYQFNRYFALEGGYFDLGRFGFSLDTLPAGTLRGDIKIKGANLDALGFLPFTEKFAAFVRVGGTYEEAKDSFVGTGAVVVPDPNRRKRSANFKFGLGLQYNFTDAFGMRLEGERYRIDDAFDHNGDVDLISLGMIYRFGTGKRVTRTVAQPAAAPAPAAAAVPPMTVVVPVAEPTQRYCSILDFQFEVNQDDIQREEKEKLRVIGTFLTKYPGTTAVIEGHTDNVGQPSNNKLLSQRRADAVVAYLVQTLHVSPARLSAVGYGDSRPIGDNRTEEGKRANRRIGAIVACATDIEGLSVLPERLTMALLIEFDRNEAAIKPQYHDDLRRLGNFLKANPTVTATVEGHTGNLQATEALALEISQRRAQAVVNYLVDNLGIARSRLSAEGFGKTRRIAYNTSLEGQQENRRVNVIINYPKH